MHRDLVGTVWAVSVPQERTVLVLGGPFRAANGQPEYMIAPLYTGREAGFLWSDEDLCITERESPFDEPRYAAIWNVRPALASDLDIELGTVSADALADIRDAYWASLNEERASAGPRAGNVRIWQHGRVAKFRESELERWAVLSGRALGVVQSEVAQLGLWRSLKEIAIQFADQSSVFAGSAMRLTPDESFEWILPEPQGVIDVQASYVVFGFTAPPRSDQPFVVITPPRDRVLSYSLGPRVLTREETTHEVNPLLEVMRGVA